MPKGVYDNSKRKPPSSIKRNLSLDTKQEDISRVVRESFQYFNRPLAKTDEEVAERLNEYFAQCQEEGQLPTVEDMCLALGGYRELIDRWAKRNDNRGHIIKKAKEIIAGMDAKLAAEGRIPQVVYIFRAKNYYGMKDQQEVSIAPVNTEQVSAADIREKYLGAQTQDKLPQKEKIVDSIAERESEQ